MTIAPWAVWGSHKDLNSQLFLLSSWWLSDWAWGMPRNQSVSRAGRHPHISYFYLREQPYHHQHYYHHHDWKVRLLLLWVSCHLSPHRGHLLPCDVYSFEHPQWKPSFHYCGIDLQLNQSMAPKPIQGCRVSSHSVMPAQKLKMPLAELNSCFSSS